MLKKLTQFWTNLRPYEKAGTAALALGIIIAFAFISWLFYDGNIVLGGKIDLEKAGQAGSFIAGTSGVCWALAGVFFFISALRIQSEELKAQLTEMDLQRQIFRQQSFEMTFFKLLEQFIQATENLEKTLIENNKHSQVDDRMTYAFSIFPLDFIYRAATYEVTSYPREHKKWKEAKDNFTLNLDVHIKDLRNSNAITYFSDNIDIFNKFFMLLREINHFGSNNDKYFKIILNSIPLRTARCILYASLIVDETLVDYIKSYFHVPKEFLYFESHLKNFSK